MNSKFYKSVLLATAACAIVLSGCSAPVDAVSTEAQGIKVNTQSPTIDNIERTNSFTGRVMPAGAVFIIPKVQGEITAINFEVGDKVKKGDVLFEVDDTITNLQVAQAQAAFNAAKAGFEQATGATFEVQMVQMEGQLKQAQSQKKWTENTYDIYDDSFGGNASMMKQNVNMTKSAMEKAKVDLQADPGNETLIVAYQTALMTYQQAKSTYDNFTSGYETQYNQLTQGLEQVEIGLDMAEKAYALASGPAHEEQLNTIKAQLGQAQAGYEMALQNLTYTKVTTPIDGVVQQKNVAVHGMATQQQPSFVISDEGALEISFSVSAQMTAAMKSGDIINVDSGVKTYNATIVEISAMVDQASGLFQIKAHLTADAPELLSGVSVKVTATTAKSENAVLVPADAIYYENGAPYIYLAINNVATKTFVTLGIVTETTAQITNGADASSNIITSWSPNLMDGALLYSAQEE